MSKIIGKNIGDIPGTFKDYGGGTLPSGYLLCDGTAIDRVTYKALFAALGGLATPWGVGDGSTTFNLPNGRGRGHVGAGNYTDPVSGSITRTLGASAGSEKHLLTSAQSGVPGHTHPNTDSGHQHNVYIATVTGSSGSGFTVNSVGNLGGNNGNILAALNSGSNITVTANTAASAASTHENMHPYIVVTKMIKY